jgi:signal transduction histidine kinase
VVATACAAWAAVLLLGEGPALAFAPVLGLAVVHYRRRPIASALGVASVTLALHLSGVSEENAASVAAGLTVTYALGRHSPGARGYAPVLVLGLALTIVDWLTVADAVFVGFVLTGTWACGRLVRRRTHGARRASAAAAELADRDPEVLAAQVVAEERARLAGDALGVIRDAVEAMHRDAVRAEPELDPRSLGSIQEGGRAAVAELRRLLGLLRVDVEPAPGGRSDPSGAGDAAGPEGRRADWPVAAALLLASLVDVAAWAAGALDGSIALALAFVATAALARARTAAACILATLPSVLALGLDAPIAYGFSTALASGVLAWWAGVDRRPRALLAGGALIAVTVVAVNAHSPGNEAILLAMFALGALAGHVWGQRAREGVSAAALVARLQDQQDAAVERARSAERLRLARELHDVASSAVGAMVLQAGAALATRDRDPEAARAAVRSVQAAGLAALGELDALFGLLDAGAVGPAGLAGQRPDEDIADAVTALAERMRAGGLDVRLTAPEALPDDPMLVATAYRIVQEALTNAARYAPRSRVEIVLAAQGASLAVTVRDDGGGTGRAGAAVPEGGGFGLVGLAERVQALGGELATGPLPEGGFEVRARLPAREREGAPA